MSNSNRILVKVAEHLLGLNNVNQTVLVDTVDRLPLGVEKAASFADSKARDGTISFRDRDRILFELSGRSHVKMALLENAVLTARPTLEEKTAAAKLSYVDDLTEFCSS